MTPNTALTATSGSFGHLGKNLHISLRRVADLIPRKTNARTHSRRQIEQIVASIREYGFTNPVLIGNDSQVIAGHGRLEAAKLLGLEDVPVIELGHLSKKQIRAYVIADNKIAENAGWDKEILALEFEYLQSVGFDLDLTGFAIPEIDACLGLAAVNTSAADALPDDALSNEPPVTVKGDLWRLGRHLLLCEDALNPAAYGRLLGSQKAEMIFTDAPYNIPVQGHVCGAGAIKHKEFVMASGEMSTAEFTDFLRRVVNNLIRHSKDGSIHFLFMDWRHMSELMEAAKGYTELKQLCIWNKTNGGMGSLYRSKHEMVFVYKNGTAPHINNIELGKHGRYRTNVWDYAGVNTFRKDRMEELQMHPTVKPVELVKDAILDCSSRQGIILDPFGGSGTTLIASELVDRTARLIELDPQYVDCTIKRFQALTQTPAVHVDSGKTFNELQAKRGEK